MESVIKYSPKRTRSFETISKTQRLIPLTDVIIHALKTFNDPLSNNNILEAKSSCTHLHTLYKEEKNNIEIENATDEAVATFEPVPEKTACKHKVVNADSIRRIKLEWTYRNMPAIRPFISRTFEEYIADESESKQNFHTKYLCKTKYPLAYTDNTKEQQRYREYLHKRTSSNILSETLSNINIAKEVDSYDTLKYADSDLSEEHKNCKHLTTVLWAKENPMRISQLHLNNKHKKECNKIYSTDEPTKYTQSKRSYMTLRDPCIWSCKALTKTSNSNSSSSESLTRASSNNLLENRKCLNQKLDKYIVNQEHINNRAQTIIDANLSCEKDNRKKLMHKMNVEIDENCIRLKSKTNSTQCTKTQFKPIFRNIYKHGYSDGFYSSRVNYINKICCEEGLFKPKYKRNNS